MEWQHECSRAWLEARKKFLTATDIAKLIPAYNRAQRAKNKMKIVPEFAALFAEKIADEEIDTRAPSSAAARGHILEPYAVQEFIDKTNIQMYHWDDALIYNSAAISAFSPDALDIKQVSSEVTWCFKNKFITCKDESVTAPTKLLEIKSYNPNKHVKSLLTGKDKVPERFQIAAAMAICPSIETGYLCFYCPQLKQYGSIEWFEYDQEDLAEEIELVQDLILLYDAAASSFMNTFELSRPLLATEESIYLEHCNDRLLEL